MTTAFRRQWKRRRRARASLWVIAIVVALPPLVRAHEVKTVGPFRLTIGWGDEPAFSGLKNAVEVDIADAGGSPVGDIDGSLAVDVSFGDAHFAAPLQRVRDRPGKFRAWIVPTRPGTYTFHITGAVKGQPVDVSSTCSNHTFACVGDVAEIHFPAKDPSTGQLAERVNRSLPRAERAVDTAAAARNVAVGAIAVAALAVALTFRPRARNGSKDA